MQLVCPSCHTAFHVDPEALGAGGRTVRCARCRSTWFARQEDLVAAPAISEVAAVAPAEPAENAAVAGMPVETASAVVLPKVVPWNDTVMVEVNPSPPIAVDASQGDAAPLVQAMETRKAPPRPAVVARRVRTKSSPLQRRLVAAAVLIGILAFAAIGSRATIVRAAPDLAGLYAAIGLPVNLRGLEFSGLKTMHEMQDGIPVLVIEGEIVNVSRQPAEVPRLRLAVLGPDARELYSWTALLPRSVLPEGEKVSFRSRLAAPPADGKQVMVRFLNRFDLTANGR
jgi:predicted Zn finger-like uncharacterized protein